jgi:hypothetical protein
MIDCPEETHQLTGWPIPFQSDDLGTLLAIAKLCDRSSARPFGISPNLWRGSLKWSDASDEGGHLHCSGEQNVFVGGDRRNRQRWHLFVICPTAARVHA